MSSIRRAACALLAGVLLVPATCLGGSRIDPALDLYARPQQLVRLADGRRLNLLCLGSGSPTVILEAGAGGSTLDWRRVHGPLSRLIRTCAYDRAGMGFSDPGPLPRTAEAVAADFAALLSAASIKPPYVMVAHSLGSYFVRLFADHRPGDVVGMVLVDPSIEYQDRRFGEIAPAYLDLLRKDDETARECLRLAQAGTLQASLPIFRECTYGYARDPQFSDALFDVQIRRRLSPDYRASLLSETHEMNGADGAQLDAARRSYGRMPLIVLTQSDESADVFPGLTPAQIRAMNELWVRMHEELTALSSRGSHRLVERSGHYIQQDRPDVVINSVKEILREIRHPAP